MEEKEWKENAKEKEKGRKGKLTENKVIERRRGEWRGGEEWI